MDFGLAKRVIAVTGGGSGIGRACAMMAAEQGASVMVGDFSRAAAEATVAEITQAGGRAFAAFFDVRDDAAVSKAFADGEGALGPLDALIASAGVGGAAPAESMSMAAWTQVLDTNLTGLFNCAQAAGRSMLQRGHGSIVAIGSGAGLGGMAERSHYSASKHGVNGLVKSLAIEWGRRGVRVNCVSPGPVDTPLLRQHWSQERLERIYLDRIPLGRLAHADDIARAALFLLSDAAAYITGVVLPVNGGLSAGYSTSYAAIDG
ncbi:SDR family NAD(P)-dependent oxidoreductase [Hydrogenophaga sp.]|uniref:SDR family NAD(P)-dependent oxidoreductase n=1 Tax=Hydrogenophaga sp. TaxID=1904254 RepID=UPI00271B476D|nr:SDR family NAD(P)-dependent oxidoreductase [Hydrogenophaga sp.]MDO9435956.1 SDR family NAD(P)-dependent oxidoreductase [Hydrogenophaga sp.]